MICTYSGLCYPDESPGTENLKSRGLRGRPELFCPQRPGVGVSRTKDSRPHPELLPVQIVRGSTATVDDGVPVRLLGAGCVWKDPFVEL